MVSCDNAGSLKHCSCGVTLQLHNHQWLPLPTGQSQALVLLAQGICDWIHHPSSPCGSWVLLRSVIIPYVLSGLSCPTGPGGVGLCSVMGLYLSRAFQLMPSLQRSPPHKPSLIHPWKRCLLPVASGAFRFGIPTRSLVNGGFCFSYEEHWFSTELPQASVPGQADGRQGGRQLGARPLLALPEHPPPEQSSQRLPSAFRTSCPCALALRVLLCSSEEGQQPPGTPRQAHVPSVRKHSPPGPSVSFHQLSFLFCTQVPLGRQTSIQRC